MRVLGLIPARGGSKGVPRKNVRMLAGKPLIAWTIEAALAARSLARVVVSTEDEEIAEVARKWGAEVPFLRPPELATDEAPTLPVVRHALEWMERQGERFDAVCLLQPTSPCRRVEWIDACAEMLERLGVDSVATVLPVPAEHNPDWVYFADERGLLRLSTGEKEPLPRRQDLPAAYHREGSVYLARTETVLVKNSLYGDSLAGYVVPSEESINIDTFRDWERAEEALALREK